MPQSIRLARFSLHSQPWRRTLLCLVCLISVILLGACHQNAQAQKQKFVSSGDKYTAAGKYPEAIVEYRNAIQQDPSAGDAREKLADAQAGTGDIASATKEYARAADLRPTDTKIQLKSGESLLLTGAFDEARDRAAKVLRQDPKNLQAQILLANSLAGLKNVDQAVIEIEEALRLDPNRSATYSNLGVLELSRGKVDAAEKAFKQAVALNPRSAPAHLALANLYWVTARWPDAERELTQATEIDPANVLAHRALANFCLATNRPDTAEAHLQKVVELTKSPSATLALADFYIARDNKAAARDVLGRLANSPAAEVRLAELDRAAGRGDDGLKRLNSVLERDRANLQALLAKSAFLLADGKTDEAYASAKIAVDSQPDSAAAQFALGRVQAARRQTDAAMAAFREALRLNPRANEAKLALAQLQLASGQTDESVGLAQEVLQANPQDAGARLMFARGLIARGDLQRADTEVSHLRTKYPNVAAVHVASGLLLGRQGDLAGARKALERAAQLDPNSPEAVGAMVALELAQHRRSEARARVDEALRRNGSSTTFMLMAARTYAALQDDAAAEQMLRRVLEKEPSQLMAYGALGQMYMKQGRLDAALKEFDVLAQREAKPVAALTLTGIILEAQGKTNAARERFERVIQIDASAPVAANNLAWIYAQQDGTNLDVALQLAQTASKRLPDAPEVNDTLGFIYYKKNLVPLAVAAINRSVDKDPGNSLYHYHLGLAYARSGDAPRARHSLERALELKPDFSGAEDARNLLKSLAAS